jgi:hypothetical protein
MKRDRIGKTNGHTTGQKLVTLFVDNSEASRKAEMLLNEKGLPFVRSMVKPDSPDLMDFEDLPRLAGVSFEWSGLPAIERFVANGKK